MKWASEPEPMGTQAHADAAADFRESNALFLRLWPAVQRVSDRHRARLSRLP
ncbi:MAG: hypothetical protein VBE63_13455 [Lamprobacter sp.]|uniref:hypothetical protein n=1 Tax=Lamprobacter sp. TaxID=3100796 RepID=UPI002B25F2FF|nr:hypothetical protein [Lamprobacter sp.]MEA3640936.1 hypothetical protein [Lamprobacter sp.]